MPKAIKRVAVLGAGVMGAQIAAHMANAGIPCLLLDMPSSGANKNRIAEEGLNRAKALKPPVFFLPELTNHIALGNFDDDLEKLAQVDLVVEAVIERLDVKQQLFQKVAKVHNPDGIIASNTSGIRIADIGKGLSASFRQHLLGMHFFNPPRYLKLLEITPTPDTLSDVVESVSHFGKSILGKGVVYSKDTPNFIANRIGAFVLAYSFSLMQQGGFTVEEVDALTGPLIGRPKSATFRLLDIIGIDTFVEILKNSHAALADDPMRKYFETPPVLLEMVKRGWTGEKKGQGFYKKIKNAKGESDFLVLDLKMLDYRPKQPVTIKILEAARGIKPLKERLHLLLTTKDKAGDFLWPTTAAALWYSAQWAPTISKTLVDLDRAMQWGFRWESGPFELWDMIGFDNALHSMTAYQLKTPAWIEAMANAGKKSFYHNEPCRISFYDLERKTYAPVPSDPEEINLALLKETERAVLQKNPGASLLDLGDGILCLEFHNKMNIIWEDVLKMGFAALETLEKKYEGLVIGNQAADFSAGANLAMILMLAQQKEWEVLDKAIHMFQTFNRALKYSGKPIVAAPRGRALGGGCEVVLHSPMACAHSESYLGLVELGAGVIPAAGGTTEMVSRSSPESLGRAFDVIAFSKVSSSALEAKAMGFLRESDSIVMNEDYLLYAAKEKVINAAKKGYTPAKPTVLKAVGKIFTEPMAAKIEAGVRAGKITEFQAFLAHKLAWVMSGGNISTPEEKSEQHFLDLERETFLSLCGEPKTQERMQHLLKTGKPLIN